MSVELLAADPGHDWFYFTKEEEPLYKIDIPKTGDELQEISGNRVFWSYLDVDGVPKLAFSKINIPKYFNSRRKLGVD
jgi:hypothetical protein